MQDLTNATSGQLSYTSESTTMNWLRQRQFLRNRLHSQAAADEIGSSRLNTESRSSLNALAAVLFRLDLWTLDTFREASSMSQDSVNLINQDAYNAVQQATSPENLNETITYDAYFDQRARYGAEQFSDAELIAYIRETRVSAHFDQFVNLRTLLYERRLSEKAYYENLSHKRLMSASAIKDSKMTPPEYLANVVTLAAIERQKLEAIIRAFEDLRICISKCEAANVIRSGTDDQKIVEGKLAALEANIGQAYKLLNRIFMSTALINQTVTKQIHQKAATAYSATRSAHSMKILIFLIPLISMTAFIPATKAFHAAPPELGTTRDANYWQLWSNSIMQVLGLFTVLWPAYEMGFQRKASRLSTILICSLAVISLMCTILALPAYTRWSTGWSGLLTLMGSVAQNLVLLQFINFM